MIQVEKRSQSRFSFDGKQDMGSVQVNIPSGTADDVEAEIFNISNGGCCLRVSRLLENLDIIKIMIPLSNNLPRIPTLGEVRWVRPDTSSNEGYTVGMRFIF